METPAKSRFVIKEIFRESIKEIEQKTTENYYDLTSKTKGIRKD